MDFRSQSAVTRGISLPVIVMSDRISGMQLKMSFKRLEKKVHQIWVELLIFALLGTSGVLLRGTGFPVVELVRSGELG